MKHEEHDALSNEEDRFPRLISQAVKNALLDVWVQRHRETKSLLKQQESKTLKFRSSLRWNFNDDCKDDKRITHAVLKTVAAFLNTEGGDLLIGVADDGTPIGLKHDRLESDDKFMLHLAQVVRNGLGARASTCIDPKMQVVQGKTICLVSCQRSPVFGLRHRFVACQSRQIIRWCG